MHITILVTNTDESAFAQAHPRDGEKFMQLLGPVRPDWQFSIFSVKDGAFPAGLADTDGVIVTGSPASVHDPDPWVGQLLETVRHIVQAGIPLFGACFGHQAVALALGGTVARNPTGWVLGLVNTQMQGLGHLRLYAAHLEQVTAPPAGAQIVGATADCPIAAMTIGPRVLTTQYHPEMTHDFIAALTEHLKDTLPARVISTARASLHHRADTDAIAAHIVTFFEAAVQDRAASKSIAVT
jgi:GMP synthase-like glutamine amidotransferase